MDELEKAIEKSLNQTEPSDSSKDQICREESVHMFEKRVRKARVITWSFLAIEIAAMIAAAVFLQYATSTRMMIWCAIMFLVAFEGTILVKLWYWVVSSKISLLTELKQLEMLITAQHREDEK